MRAPQVFWKAGAVLVVVWVWTSHFCSSYALAVSPREDFERWYAEWRNRVPETYHCIYKGYFGREPGEPEVRTVWRWKEPPYLLCVVQNSGTGREYRFLENADYCASIETPLGRSVWQVSDYAHREDAHFASLSSDGASGGGKYDSLYIAWAESIFDRPHSVAVSESGDKGKRIAEITFTFRKRSTDQPRDVAELTVFLDERVGWMPVEIRKRRVGGINNRSVLSGWQRRGDVWLYSKRTGYVQMSPSDKETLNFTDEWDFPDVDAAVNRQQECFLSYYGFPEPGKPTTHWHVLAFLALVLLCIAGYLLLRRRS